MSKSLIKSYIFTYIRIYQDNSVQRRLDSRGELLKEQLTASNANLREELQAAIDALQGKADIDAVPTHQQVADLEASLRLKADAMNVPTNEHLHASSERLQQQSSEQLEDLRNALQQRPWICRMFRFSS